MILKIIIASFVFVIMYFIYQYIYIKHINNFDKRPKRLIDINTVRRGVLIAGIICVSGIAIHSLIQVNAQQDDEISYLDNYISKYDQMTYTDDRIYEIYTNYNIYFSGIYLENSTKVLLIREDIPQDGLDYLQISNLSYQLVEYNYHELLSARIQIGKTLHNLDGFVAIYTDEISNCIRVEVITNSVLPSALDEFIESEILQVSEVDCIPVTT